MFFLSLLKFQPWTISSDLVICVYYPREWKKLRLANASYGEIKVKEIVEKMKKNLIRKFNVAGRMETVEESIKKWEMNKLKMSMEECWTISRNKWFFPLFYICIVKISCQSIIIILVGYEALLSSSYFIHSFCCFHSFCFQFWKQCDRIQYRSVQI